MNDILDRCRRMQREGATIDQMLDVMREAGLSRIDSMRLMMELTGMTLRDAKAAVHLSRVWGDLREETDAFHDELERAAEQDAKPPTE